MKRALALSLFFVFGIRALIAAESEYQTIERGPHHKVVRAPTGRDYVVLGDGLHYQKNGDWVESKEEIELVPGGAVARQGQHAVNFGPNLKAPGSIVITTPDNKRFSSHVMGLIYYDAATGNSVLIAETKDSVGLLVAPNHIVYPDAMTDFLVDVQFTYRRGGFEQDIVLREPLPSPAEYGLAPETTRLQVWTEFTEAPAASIKELILRREERPDFRQAMVDPDFKDSLLNFGVMKMAQGKAFSTDVQHSDHNNSMPVGKEWALVEQRQFLIESVEFPSIKPLLDELPPVAAANARKAVNLARRTATKDRRDLVNAFSAVPAGMASVSQKSIKPGQPTKQRGVVIDFNLINYNTNNHTFRADLTYQIDGSATFGAVTTVEGGTVIKFNPNSQIWISSASGASVKFLTDQYRPAVFTAKDDNAHGEVLSGSTGNPSDSYYARNALYFDYPYGGTADIHNARFMYAWTAVYLAGGGGHRVRHSQIVGCYEGIEGGYGTSVRVQNALVSAQYAFVGYMSVLGEHLTLSGNVLGSAGAGVVLTNSLLNFTTAYSYSGVENYTVTAGDFQTVGGGSKYLASNTYRNRGTTTIDPVLAADLKKRTTYPPVVFQSTAISTDATYGPQAQRDTDTPDLGYHYDPLDYAFGGVDGNANITFAPGTAVGWFRISSGYYHAGHGLHMDDRKIVTFDGRAETPNYWVRCSIVQEGTTGLWNGGYGTGGITGWASQSGSVTNSPELRARFTRFSMLGGEGNHFRDDNGYLTVRLTDCELWSGGFGAYVLSGYFTNCLMDRVQAYMVHGLAGNEFHMRNCTWYRGHYQVTRNLAFPVSVKDCVFDGTTNVHDNLANTDYNYNAFTVRGQLPVGANDVSVTNFNWQIGPFGRFYLPTSSSLINTGSVANASLAGLYHYTASIDQTKEGTTALDIGYHYPAASKVTFVGTNETTRGDWKGIYGSEGYNVIGDVAAYPSYATVSASGKADHTWSNAPTDARALQRAGSGRIAACWYTVSSCDIALTQNDGRPHRLAVYCLDWDTTLRGETIQIRDSVTGTVYDTRTVSSFNGGKYFIWDILGNVTVRVTDTTGVNAVISGLFFGPASLRLADSDSDGLPDYREDVDGNGIVGGTESDFSDSDTDNDGMNDYLERIQGRNPLVSGTGADSSGLINLKVYTPLK